VVKRIENVSTASVTQSVENIVDGLVSLLVSRLGSGFSGVTRRRAVGPSLAVDGDYLVEYRRERCNSRRIVLFERKVADRIARSKLAVDRLEKRDGLG
jgi:hypothetical protein